MKRSGSVTVFTSLFLAVFLLVFQVLLQAVQIAGGRVQAEAGVEEGLYSVFAGYDREMLENYHIFMVDGSYGSDHWKLQKMYQTVKNRMEESCEPGKSIIDVCGDNLWKCSDISGSITAYTLLTDDNGAGFQSQAITYMKDTLGIQGIRILLEQYEKQKNIWEDQEKTNTDLDQVMDTYETAKTKGEEEKNQKEQNQKEQNQKEQNDKENQEAQEEVQEITETEKHAEVPKDFVNPLEVIQELRKKGVLALVMPKGKTISQAGFEDADRLSKRTLEKGMGVPCGASFQESTVEKLLFQAYVMEHLSNFSSKNSSSDTIQYQVEYVIGGKACDEENLREVVKELLLLREAANMVYLLKSPIRQQEIHEMAWMICGALGLPAIEGVVSLALQAAWAFGESIVDVRQLLEGGNVPLIKTDGSWTVSIENLARLAEVLEERRQQGQKGLTYEEYLSMLLLAKKETVKVQRTMEIAEQVIRSMDEKNEFRLDHGVVYLQTEMKVSIRGRMFTLERDYGYDMS